MYVYIYIYTRPYAYIYIFNYIYIYCTHAFLSYVTVCVNPICILTTFVNGYKRIINTYVCVCTYIYIMCIYVCLSAYRHTYIYIHIRLYIVWMAKPQEKTPAAQALEELKEMKSMGFNLLRIHAAVLGLAMCR